MTEERFQDIGLDVTPRPPVSTMTLHPLLLRAVPFTCVLALLLSFGLSSAAFAAGEAGKPLIVSDFGAVGDGTTLNTDAIQKAIDVSYAQGGGTVHIPAGRFLTGTLQLKDNVVLHLEENAVLLGSTRAADYLNVDPFVAGDGIPLGYALIVAVGAKHVGIEGEGTIDGQGKAVKAAQEKYTVRPFLIRWIRCNDVVVRNVHLTSPGAWTLHFFQCQNVTANGLTIRSVGLINNDGIDIDSCQTVRINGCDIESGDDAICLKATSPLACRDVVVTGCKLKTKCNGIKLGTESLGDFENVAVSDCQLRQIGMAGIALYSVDGSQLHDVAISDLTMDDVTVPISVRLGARLKTFRPGDQAKPPGRLYDVKISGLRVTGARQIGVLVNGIPGHPVENLTLDQIEIQLAGGGTEADAKVQLPEKEAAYPEMKMFGQVMPAYGLYVRHARGVNFSNVHTTVLKADARPPAVYLDVEGKTTAQSAEAANSAPPPANGSAPAKPLGVVESPDGKIKVEFALNAAHAPVYRVQREGKAVLQESRLGLICEDADFSQHLTFLDEADKGLVEDHYELLTAKRRHINYRGNRKIFHLATAEGQKINVVFQVSNDGVAFRYSFPPNSEGGIRAIKEELSSFHFLPETKAWLQPMSVAKTGWKSTNPSYEEHYAQEIPVGTPSTFGAGWAYPALFHSGDTWLLVSESALGRGDCATRLRHESPNGEYTVGFPDPRETISGRPVTPSTTIPGLLPWRLIAIGPLQTIAESTLGTDLADPAKTPLNPAIKPGKAAWSWALLGDKNTTYEVQKRFVDYAAEMGWAYCLIDAQWDTQIGYDKIKELSEYAAGKNVGLLLWYNSNGDWNGAPQTPINQLTSHRLRMEEFGRLKSMGIKGLKVDFFGGDGAPMINYYLDLLDDAAPFGLLVNFHGTTLPRGWQRTYPHLMTMEAIRGFEFITFEQKNADLEPTHAAMLPFTRNVFDPMDFTPVCLDKIGKKIQRRTTSAFELALAVLFTSGIQHYAEIPEGMAKMPDYVKTFMRNVPSIWDDTRFLDGYPGKLAILARKGEGRWYVAGINGEATEKPITLDLSTLPADTIGTGTLITDGDGPDHLFEQRALNLSSDKKLTLTLKPNGGFVVVFP